MTSRSVRPLLLGKRDICRVLGCGMRTLEGYYRGENVDHPLAYRKLGGRVVVTVSDLGAFLRKNDIQVSNKEIMEHIGKEVENR